MDNSLTPEQISDKLYINRMTQTQLAEKLLIAPETLSKYMTGKAPQNTKTGRLAFQYFKRIESE